MRRLTVIVALLLCTLSTTLVQAQSPQYTAYLPAVFIKKIWMIDPEMLVLQPEHLPLAQITANYHISNEEAIKQSDNPDATRAAFEAQGRINAFFRRFEADGGYQYFEHLVILYVRPEGASLGLQGLIAGRTKTKITKPGVDEFYLISDFQDGMYIHIAIFQIDNYVHTVKAGFILQTRANPSILQQKVNWAIERQHMIAP
jgi:hypothetical protein